MGINSARGLARVSRVAGLLLCVVSLIAGGCLASGDGSEVPRVAEVRIGGGDGLEAVAFDHLVIAIMASDETLVGATCLYPEAEAFSERSLASFRTLNQAERACADGHVARWRLPTLDRWGFSGGGFRRAQIPILGVASGDERVVARAGLGGFFGVAEARSASARSGGPQTLTLVPSREAPFRSCRARLVDDQEIEQALSLGSPCDATTQTTCITSGVDPRTPFAARGEAIACAEGHSSRVHHQGALRCDPDGLDVVWRSWSLGARAGATVYLRGHFARCASASSSIGQYDQSADCEKSTECVPPRTAMVRASQGDPFVIRESLDCLPPFPVSVDVAVDLDLPDGAQALGPLDVLPPGGASDFVALAQSPTSVTGAACFFDVERVAVAPRESR